MKLKLGLFLTGSWLVVASLLSVPPAFAAAGTCTPSADYGSATQTVSIPATGTYTIWSRLATDASAHNSYMLQIDSSNCFTVGSSAAKTIPVYASGTSTYFVNDSSNWLKTDTSGATVQVANLTAGNHTIALIGNAPNVVIDRVVFTQDTSCIPTGTGDNCASPPDVTPPVVSITAPADNATISSSTTATATATDDTAVASVGFYIDGTLKATDTSSPYNYSLDPAVLGVGPHTILAKAYDAAGNNASSSIVHITATDTVKPTVTLTTPANGSTQSGTYVAAATATDNVGVTKVEFYADGAPTPTATDTSGVANVFNATYDTTSLSNGSHTLLAKAYDAAGNTTSVTSTYTVSNSAPTGGDITPPTQVLVPSVSGSLLNSNSLVKPYDSKNYLVTANVADASGIQQVVFKVDGTVKATDITAPFSYTADLSTLGCGAHSITAVASDKAPAHNSTTTTENFNVTRAQDIDNNCVVNYLDLSLLGSNFNKTVAGGTGNNLLRSDINGDGVVNYLDLSSLASNYLK